VRAAGPGWTCVASSVYDAVAKEDDMSKRHSGWISLLVCAAILPALAGCALFDRAEAVIVVDAVSGTVPLTISFDARAMDQIAFAGVYAPYGGDLGRDTCGFWFRDRENRRGGDRKEGLQMTTYRRTDDWKNSRRLRPDADYTMKAVFDGTGRVAWWINDSIVHEYVPLETDAVFTGGSISVRLIARTASTRQPTCYDNVVIEGELLSAPKERPTD